MFDDVLDQAPTQAAPFSPGLQPVPEPAKMSVQNLNFWYGDNHALKSVTLDIPRHQATAFIGPSGCGKTTLLRCLNRMQDEIPDVRLTGRIEMDGQDIYDPAIEACMFRRRFGWVAQKPNPFPWSVYENVAYGARLHGRCTSRADLAQKVERHLTTVGLWDEVKDRLSDPGTSLSGGQQQRLCIARALSTDPEVMLMDEPCSSLDPIATERIEALIQDLKTRLTVIIITHNLAQARRVSDRVAFFKLGELLEEGPTEAIFTHAVNPACRDYVAGLYG
jgi:phosphate transport system ATP-binding protein